VSRRISSKIQQTTPTTTDHNPDIIIASPGLAMISMPPFLAAARTPYLQ
jgi:hypothetical protein